MRIGYIDDAAIAALGAHVCLAIVLFCCVNWIGKHAVEFGYTSTTLFDEPAESVALNFFLRALSPAVFIIAVSASLVALGYDEWRLGIQAVSIYYYVIRVIAIFLLSRQRLISWPRFVVHAIFGVGFAYLAYKYLIIPNISLLPNLEQAGNELWLAILAFLYAVSNKVAMTDKKSARRRNNYINAHYGQAKKRFERIISQKTIDDKLKLIIYSVIVFEDYARPATVRRIERLMFWRSSITTGIMQVKSGKMLSDMQSVSRGSDMLAQYWADHVNAESLSERVWSTISDYNSDYDYVRNVMDVLEIIALRIDLRFKSVYEEIRS